ncbi:MAG: transglycosylase family protein [Nocardiopsaceae bacterium]|nr:transglycosylase family protein [Nocardiopsaceae bacterium]
MAAAVVLLQGAPADAGPSQAVAAPRTASQGSGLADNMVAATTIHRDSSLARTRALERERAAARRKHLAAERAAHRRAQQTPPPPTSGSDPAHSALGICIRNAEQGGSYAWGPGNGGGAYQFLLSTWEKYGGAASAYGVAGPAYQDRIFDNAIAAGGASNWTAYDGC